ncbi:hypothetical protein CONPUDRAFT_168309 [Coniophora puteana RWD-64-598 SS2]|uniref:Oxidoreductase-like domain-containing protein n=1 Tax=Coniophora puteana (strain RWD-64-598) TaxID=741705 RepID=A0A5M3MFH1_CONPW|nr:uncharacterized protein CONPUDRAFT_168309 [Coniophora puteana RWD-64-598 SS2]EIW77365.1 hypothetical protein CONPUDRAFT_168309 [Coniophora puteana RWD-64-598 SS2]
MDQDISESDKRPRASLPVPRFVIAQGHMSPACSSLLLHSLTSCRTSYRRLHNIIRSSASTSGTTSQAIRTPTTLGSSPSPSTTSPSSSAPPSHSDTSSNTPTSTKHHVGPNGSANGNRSSHTWPHTPARTRPMRRGQDLSARWHRLENALRHKAALGVARDVLGGPRSAMEGAGVEGGVVDVEERGGVEAVDVDVGRKDDTVARIAGLEIPDEPRPPADDECCMSGCAVCVYDLYDDALNEYRERVESLQTALRANGVPEAEWPARIRTAPSSITSPFFDAPGGTGGASSSQVQQSPQAAQRSASTSAFEALEASLRGSKEEGAGVGEGSSSAQNSSSTLSGGSQPRRQFSTSAVAFAEDSGCGKSASRPVGMRSIPIPRQAATHRGSVSETDENDTKPASAALRSTQQSPFAGVTTGTGRSVVEMRRKRRWRLRPPSLGEVYEGVRWVLFGHR